MQKTYMSVSQLIEIHMCAHDRGGEKEEEEEEKVGGGRGYASLFFDPLLLMTASNVIKLPCAETGKWHK